MEMAMSAGYGLETIFFVTVTLSVGYVLWTFSATDLAVWYNAFLNSTVPGCDRIAFTGYFLRSLLSI